MKKIVRRAFLKSALIVCAMLLCVLTASIIRLTLFDEIESVQPAASIENPIEDSIEDSIKDSMQDSMKDASQSRQHTDLPDSGNSSQNNHLSNSSQDSSLPASSDSGAARSDPTKTTLLFAGDIYFSDYVLAAYGQSGIQGVIGTSLLKQMKNADLTIANNEFPFSTRGAQAPDKQFTFRIDPACVSLLTESGIDLVTLANNHVLDYGTEALADTFHTLDDAGIAYMGAGKTVKRAEKLILKKAGGRTFGFLAASRVFPVASWNVENQAPGVLSAYDPTRLLAAVAKARGRCDYLCVYVHWGIERNTTPEPYQTELAHALIDAGADAVVGAHPHVLQGVELYQGKPIFYSLGNFIFYQSIPQTAVAKLTIGSDDAVRWQLLPARADNAYTSLVTEETARQQFYEAMDALSVNVRFSKHGTITQIIPK